MPVYEYKCAACEQHFDIEQSFTDDTLTVMDGCEIDDEGQHRLKKVFSAVGISFKGEGFYRNDARSASKTSSTPSSTSSGNGGGSGSEPSSGSTTSESSSSTDSSPSSPSTSSTSSSSTSSDSGSKAPSGS